MPTTEKERERRFVSQQRQAKFLDLLMRCGMVNQAARDSGADKGALYKERKADPEFAKAWDEAKALGVVELEDEAYRRARGWVDYDAEGNPHFRCSDTLMIFLLKAANPAKYRDNYKATDDTEPDPDAFAADIMPGPEDAKA